MVEVDSEMPLPYHEKSGKLSKFNVKLLLPGNAYVGGSAVESTVGTTTKNQIILSG